MTFMFILLIGLSTNQCRKYIDILNNVGVNDKNIRIIRIIVWEKKKFVTQERELRVH